MKTTIIALAMLALAPFAAHADFNYTYVEGGFVDADFDDGLFVGGSYEINEHFYGVADLYSFEFSDQLQIGAGYHMPINERLDVYGEVRYIDYEFGSGMGLTGAARFAITDRFEVGGGINYYNNDAGSDTNPFLVGMFDFTQELSGLIELELGDNADIMKLGVRFGF